LWFGGKPDASQRKKAFFFEKKKQKTFGFGFQRVV
jgi:hypothetical protein